MYKLMISLHFSMLRFSPRLGVLFSNQIKSFLFICDLNKNSIRVTEVYSIPTSIMTHLLITFTTGHDLEPNGTDGVLEILSNIGVLV